MLLRTLSVRFLGPRAREGVARAQWVGALVRVHRKALVRAALDEGLSADDALDAVQDGAATLLSRSDWVHLEGAPDEALRLLLTLVRNQARNARRRKWRDDVPLDALPEAHELDTQALQLEQAVEDAQAHLTLTGCISTLKETQRAVVLARFFEGSSSSEVAASLGLSPGNVAVTLHRARAQLKTCMAKSRIRYGVE